MIANIRAKIICTIGWASLLLGSGCCFKPCGPTPCSCFETLLCPSYYRWMRCAETCIVDAEPCGFERTAWHPWPEPCVEYPADVLLEGVDAEVPGERGTDPLDAEPPAPGEVRRLPLPPGSGEWEIPPMPEVAPAEDEVKGPDSPENNQEDNQSSPFREEESSSGERGAGLPLGTKGEKPAKNGSQPPEPLVPGDTKSQPKAAVPEPGGSAAPTADLAIRLSWLEDVDTGAMDEPKQGLTKEREEQQESPASAQHNKSTQGDEPGRLAVLEALRVSF